MKGHRSLDPHRLLPQSLAVPLAVLACWIIVRGLVWWDSERDNLRAAEQMHAPVAMVTSHARHPELPNLDPQRGLAVGVLQDKARAGAGSATSQRFVVGLARQVSTAARTAHPIPAAAVRSSIVRDVVDRVPDVAPIAPAFPDQSAPSQSLKPTGTAALSASAIPPSPAVAPDRSPSEAGRWSGDGWLLLRQGRRLAGLAAGKPAYGASQAGLVIRYRLSPGSLLRPSVYLRASTALGPLRERELALGLALRPDKDLPLSIMAEARGYRLGRGDAMRGGVMVVTEVAPLQLPRRFRGEVYGQAGLVGGAGGGLFADGQLRLEHCLNCRSAGGGGRADLMAGAGLWGGAQPGVARLDGGPGLSLRLPVGSAAALRLDADWRFRLAGNAAPGSGPVATLSAGFWDAQP